MNSFQNSQKFIHILSAAKAMHPTSLQFLHFVPPTIISATKTMKTLINPISISSPNPQNLLSTRISIYSPTSIQSFKRSPLISRTVLVKCSSEMRDNGGLKDLLSGIVDKGVEELLNKEENKELLDGLEKASLRVEMAKKELDDYKRKELEAAKMRSFVNNLGNKTSEITELQREILEARSMIEEAERSLSSEMDGVSLEENGKEGINKDEERLESIKAASIAAVIGTLAGLPISLSQVTSSTELILPSAITFISCALFGVTFRYIIRRDLDDVHLKSGAAGAFAVVKGLAALEAGPRLELHSASFLSHAIDGAVYVSENLFIFIFASVGLDFFFKMRLLSPFPIKRSGANKAE